MALDDTMLVRRLQIALDKASSATTKGWWNRYLKGMKASQQQHAAAGAARRR